MDGRLFGLDIQLLFDVCVVFVFIILLFIIMSQLFFKPVRAFLEQRNAAIAADLETAERDEQALIGIKAEYDDLLKKANKEAESLISVSFKNALKRQEDIISDAKAEALAIMEQADQEIALEKENVKDEVKAQMAVLARTLAEKFVDSKDPFREAMLLEDTLKEMGGDAWQNS